MKDHRKTEIRVGLTVIAGIIIFIWIFGWAKNISITSSEKSVMIKFDNVAGLETGDMVTVNGVRKGYVNSFVIDKQDVIVKVNIDDEVTLKEDAVFAITMLDLMGGKKVEIDPGNANDFLNYDKIHKGIYYADIPEVMSLLGSVQDDLVIVLKDVKTTLKAMNNLLTDEKFNSDIKNSVSNLNDVSIQLKSLLRENREQISNLTKNSVELTEELKLFLSENKDEIKSSVGELKNVLEKTDKLLVNIDVIMSEIKNEENNLGKFLYDDQLVTDMKSAVEKLNKLTEILIYQLENDGVNVDANIF